MNVAGIIGFIDLFAPLLAKMLGGRRLLSRMLLAPLIGALLLWLADQCVLWLISHWREVSIGTATALIGVPILLWLLPRLCTGSVPLAMNMGDKVPAERKKVVRWCLFGVAGALIQRLTGNPTASPEVLGISSRAACGAVVMMFFIPGEVVWLLPASALGAALTLLIIMLVASRGGFSPERMLLAGMVLNNAFVTLLMVLMASGDPRMSGLLTWISGSTYNISLEQAIQSTVVGIILIALAPLARRWLTLLPLGSSTARSAGMALTGSRLSLLLLAAALTATATLTIGPLSRILCACWDSVVRYRKC